MFWMENPAPDILILGSSRPRENVDAAFLNQRFGELGMPHRAINLAFSGGGSVMVLRQFERHIRPRLARSAGGTAPLVVIDVAEFEINRDFYNEGQNPAFDEIEQWLPQLPKLHGFGFVKDTLRHGLGLYQKTLLDAVTEPMLNISGLYRFNGDWSKKEEARKTVRRLAFFWKNSAKDMTRPPPQGAKFINPYTVGDTQVEKLVELITAVRNSGATPVLTRLPVASWRQTFFSPGLEEQYVAAMRDVVRKTGVPFVTITNEELGLADDDYFDDVHLMREKRDVLTESILQKVILPAMGGKAL